MERLRERKREAETRKREETMVVKLETKMKRWEVFTLVIVF